MTRRQSLSITLAALLVATGIAMSGAIAPNVLAYAGGCTVTCKDRSTCSAHPDAGESCTCTCTFWGLKTANCSCVTLQPSTDG